MILDKNQDKHPAADGGDDVTTTKTSSDKPDKPIGWVILRGRLSGGVIRGTHNISIPNCRLHTEVCSPSIPDSGMASWKGADLLVQGVCL